MSSPTGSAGEIGSLAAALGGLDGIVFTAGIGEHSASLRRSVCRAAAWLGVALDEAANESGGPGSACRTARSPPGSCRPMRS
ncbi:MAG: hypothetical protein WDN49_03660 [Acetobacteraceae bacterium]